MPRLALFLLGPPRFERDGVALTLDRRKAIALLAYLAVSAQSHRRDSLVNLLWPDLDSTRGRAALRRTLHALSSALGPGWLDTDREEIGLTPATDPAATTQQTLWVDVNHFRRLLAECTGHGHLPSETCPACLQPLTEAVALVRGDLLSGFGLKDSFNFDDWLLFQAEALRREQADALDRLVHWHSAQRQFEPALAYARHRLALDPLDEDAHQELMRLYAWSGRRSSALRQYEECVAVLQDQLGVPPQDATRRLHDDIQAGRAPPLPAAPHPVVSGAGGPSPPFLKSDQPVERPVFVAREAELAQLDGHLNAALAGQGRVIFVTGEAGCGKTALIQEFALRAQAAHPDLVVAGGQGNAHTGAGDPYLPFRELLCLLTGDVEAPWAAGAMAREQAGRLWHLLPFTVNALARSGPDLIDLFVPGAPLLERARLVRPWPGESVPLSRLEDLVAQPSGTPHLQPSALFEQYSQVLCALAAGHPLLLILDDLQWADGGSVNLLFHLGRRLAGSRILIVGAYRPADLLLWRPPAPQPGAAMEAGSREVWSRDPPAPGRHPLEPIVNEFKRTFGPIEVDLEGVDSRPFVDAFLNSEANGLGDTFRNALHQRTQGHPLFTVELLRGMQERGDLVQDAEGRWVEGPALDWETLPARVEAVIAERIARLPQSVRDLLSVASVEGETFTAEVAARVQAAGQREVIRCLSDILDRQHRLVSARGIVRLGGQRVSQYRFRHILYQRYLYHNLDAVERAHLHEQVGTAIEELQGGQETVAAALQLARHFEEAGITEKAVHYLQQAGEQALRLSAYEQAVTHLTRGLDLLMTLPDSPQRSRQELTLQLTLGWAQIGHGAFVEEVARVHGRARELSQQTGKTAQLGQALGDMAIFHYVRAEHNRARDLAEEALSQAQLAQEPLLTAWSQWLLGFILFGLGEFATARDHLEQALAFYTSDQRLCSFLFLPGADVGLSAAAYLAGCLWCLGYPDQAVNRSQEALTLARELGHPLSLADVLCYGGCLCDAMRRDAPALKRHAEELVRLALELAPGWLAEGRWFQGEALALLGQLQEGIVLMREGMAAHRATAIRCSLSEALCSLGDTLARAGQPQQGLATLDEALAFVEETDERYWEAEIYRVRAEQLLMQAVTQSAGLRTAGLRSEAEASLHKAVEVARRQQARSWELRATTSLARLWQSQGRVDEARQMLAAIYGWFTEGLDTPDLQEARALLEEL